MLLRPGSVDPFSRAPRSRSQVDGLVQTSTLDDCTKSSPVVDQVLACLLWNYSWTLFLLCFNLWFAARLCKTYDLLPVIFWPHTHPFNGPFSGLPGWAGTRKVKPIWILLKQETVSGSGTTADWWVAGIVICLERGADLHLAQLMPLPFTVSCFSKILIGFTFLVPAHPGSPGQRAIKREFVCV